MPMGSRETGTALAAIFMAIACVHQSHAQSFFALQAEVAEPTASFRDAAATGYGAQGIYIHYVSPHFAVTGSAGVVTWGPRIDSPPYTDYKLVSVPVTLGGNLLLSRGVIAPYLGVSLGINYLRIRGTAPNSTVYTDESELKFTLSPQVGVGVYIVGPVGLLVTGSYNIIYTPGTPSRYFGLNAGIAVGL